MIKKSLPLLLGGISGGSAFFSAAGQTPPDVQQPVFMRAAAGAPNAGSVPGSSYTFGTHAVAIYNAEAQKSFFTSPVSKGATPSIGAMVSAPAQVLDTNLQPSFSASITATLAARIGATINGSPQIYDLTQQPFLDAPQPAGFTPRILPLLQSAPQIADLTLQPFFNTSRPAGATPRSASFVAPALQQVDISIQPIYWSAQLLAPVASRAPTSVFGAPQIVDLTLQPYVVTPPIQGTPPSGSVPGSQYTFGTHAVVLYNAEALKTFFTAPLSATVTTSGKLGQSVRAAPQLADLALQPFLDAPQLNPSGWLMTVIGASPDQTEFAALQTSRASFFPATITKPGGPLLGSVIQVGQQSYADVQPRVFTPIVGQLPIIGPVLTPLRAAPQAYDFTLQPIYRSPQIAGFVPIPITIVAAPAIADYPIQQPQLWHLTTAVLRGPVPPLTQAAPQFADLNLQPQFSRPRIIGQGKLGSFALAPPQQWDYTLQGLYQSPMTAAINYTAKAPIRLSLADYSPRLSLTDYGPRLVM